MEYSITVNSSEVEAIMAELKDNYATHGDAIDALIDSGDELFEVDSDFPTTAGARHLLCTLKPSERLGELLTAIRADERQLHAVGV